MSAAGYRPNGGQRQCILVLGMHRSGTSALTKLLSSAGAALPKRLLGAREGNPAGHWEPAVLVAYHDKMLSELGSSWYDWKPLNFCELSDETISKIRSSIHKIILEDFEERDLIVLKEPRICRFAAFFMNILSDAGYKVTPIIAYRNPVEVISSLIRRKSAWPPSLTTADAALLWLSHIVNAEISTRGLPRAFISYDAVMANWRDALLKLEHHTGLTVCRNAERVSQDIDSFLALNLRHHAAPLDSLRSDPTLKFWIADAFDALERLSQNPNDQIAIEMIDAIHQEYYRALPLLSEISSNTRASVTRMLEQLGELSESQKMLSRELENCRKEKIEIHRQYQSSASWRFSAPIRMVGGTVRRIRGFVGRQ